MNFFPVYCGKGQDEQHNIRQNCKYKMFFPHECELSLILSSDGNDQINSMHNTHNDSTQLGPFCLLPHLQETLTPNLYQSGRSQQGAVALNDTLDRMDLINIYRTLYPKLRILTLYNFTFNILKDEHMVGDKKCQ